MRAFLLLLWNAGQLDELAGRAMTKSLKNREALIAQLSAGNLDALVEELGKVRHLDKLVGKWLSAGMAAAAIDLQSVASWLIAAAHETTPERAVGMLESIGHERFLVADYWAIYGLTFEQERIPLVGGYSILRVPAQAVLQLFNVPPGDQHWKDRVLTHGILLACEKLEQAAPGGPMPKAAETASRAHSRRQNAGVGLLTLAVGNLVWCGVFWSRVIAPVRQPLLGSSGSLNHMPACVYESPSPMSEVSVARAVELFQQYAKLDADHQVTLAHSLGAYLGCRASVSEFESTLLIGIALEALLLNKREEGITDKVATRGAWLLGETFEERLDMARLLKRIYGVRSDLAHSAGRGWTLDYSRLGYEAVGLYERMITKILRDGYPDWESLVLGGTSRKRFKRESPE